MVNYLKEVQTGVVGGDVSLDGLGRGTSAVLQGNDGLLDQFSVRLLGGHFVFKLLMKQTAKREVSVVGEKI